MQQSFRRKETITDKETNHRSRPKRSNKTVNVNNLQKCRYKTTVYNKTNDIYIPVKLNAASVCH
jgi:hypothetical protein